MATIADRGPRYSTSGNVEGEFELGGRVLRNKLGIRSKREMDRLEYEALLKTQERFYGKVSLETPITTELIKRIHKDFLGRLYPWAGKYRTVNLEKSGFKWPPASLVESNMRVLEKDFLSKRTPCRPGSLRKVAEDIAAVHAELLLIHPFREGNGRLARLIANLMALQAGFPALNFGFSRKGRRSEYVAAVQKGYLGEYGSLAELVERALLNSRRLTGGPASAARRG